MRQSAAINRHFRIAPVTGANRALSCRYRYNVRNLPSCWEGTPASCAAETMTHGCAAPCLVCIRQVKYVWTV